MVREYEVYKHFNGTILIDPCVTDTFHSYKVGDIVLKSTAGLSHYNVLMDFIEVYFEWKNMYRVNSPYGLFILSYEDYATACDMNPSSKVTYLWQESELLGTKLYRNINKEIHKIFK